MRFKFASLGVCGFCVELWLIGVVIGIPGLVQVPVVNWDVGVDEFCRKAVDETIAS